MPAKRLPLDATIADVVSTLAKAEDYVRHVVSNLSRMQREYGTVVVRIGITGTGHLPNYRLDHADGPSEPIAAFDGATHKPFSDVRKIDTENWSTGSMTYQEVRDLLGKLRGINP
ncbi:MAG TPA: hypothetical protein VGG99_09700 [Acetobacteraceae bacterium]|jgi:hypothetical protein